MFNKLSLSEWEKLYDNAFQKWQSILAEAHHIRVNVYPPHGDPELIAQKIQLLREAEETHYDMLSIRQNINRLFDN